MKKEHHHDASSVAASQKRREVYLVGTVDAEMATGFVSAFRELDAKRGPITVVLVSPGGDEAAGWAIYDHLVLAKNPVSVTAFAECQSIAALILQGGQTRLLSPHCRFMLHNGSIDLSLTINQLPSAAKEAQLLTEQYWDALATRSRLTLAEIQRLCQVETYLSPKEAVAKNLADGILVPAPRKRSR